MKKIANKFHQEALTIILYLVNFACVALKLGKVGPTTCRDMYFKFQSMSAFAIRCNRAFSHDVTAAILVFQNNKTTAMFVSQTSPVGVDLFSYENAFFCFNKFA